MDKIPFFTGDVVLKSNLSIEEIGEVISRKMFGELKFEGISECIYEEVPAIYIKSSILGLQVIISGYSGFGEENGFILEIIQNNFINNSDKVKREECKLDRYLYLLLKKELNEISEIVVVDGN